MKDGKRQIQVGSHFKNGELFIEIEDEFSLDNFSKEEINLAVKEGIKTAISELLNKA
jgi:urease beta subunit